MRSERPSRLLLVQVLHPLLRSGYAMVLQALLPMRNQTQEHSLLATEVLGLRHWQCQRQFRRLCLLVPGAASGAIPFFKYHFLPSYVLVLCPSIGSNW